MRLPWRHPAPTKNQKKAQSMGNAIRSPAASIITTDAWSMTVVATKRVRDGADTVLTAKYVPTLNTA